MTEPSLDDLPSRLGKPYASQYAGGDGDEAALVGRRDIRPPLPPSAAGPVVNLGCGELVRFSQADGLGSGTIGISHEQVAPTRSASAAQIRRGNFRRIAVAAETGKLRGHIVAVNLTFVARKGVELVHPAEGSPA